MTVKTARRIRPSTAIWLLTALLAAILVAALATGGRASASGISDTRTNHPAIGTVLTRAQALNLSCPPAGDGFIYNGTGEVAHWYNTGHVFTAPTSGHQDLCDVTVWVSGNPIGENFVIEDGPAAGNCVKLASNAVNAEVIAGGCVYGQKNETLQPKIFADSDVDWYFESFVNNCMVPNGVNSVWLVGQGCQDQLDENVFFQPSPS